MTETRTSVLTDMQPCSRKPSDMNPSTIDPSIRTSTAAPRRTAGPADASPTMIPIRAFRTPVRGHAFASPPPGGERPVPGLSAELSREPDNPADPLAVAVWTASLEGVRWRIGYLDRGVAARVAPRLDAGVRVRAQLDGWSTEPDGRWRRPLLLLLPEDDPAAVPSAPDDPPRIWGRPPGVRRRRVS